MGTELERLAASLPKMWASFLRDWDRTLRAGNYPATTRYNYLLAAVQLARYLAEYAAEVEAHDAAEDPTAVRKEHVEAFQAWMIKTRSPATALNKHKGLKQFFKWLLFDEEEIDRSPMERVRQPKTTKRLVPVIRDDDTKLVLATCKPKAFIHVRDEAIIRLYYNTGARLSEVGRLLTEDIDLKLDSVRYHGKGDKERRVRFGPKTARAISRYLRLRDNHVGANLPNLWLAERGRRALAPNGIKIMLRRRGAAAGLQRVHAHRWRHNFAHEWKLAGGDTGDLMLLLGWNSEDMPRHYGASAAAERAQETQLRMGIGENV
ncbi:MULTISPECIES: tyrosine-type recombinase/integrase [unclassified Crossiella]|uniref:tyrosine-type recombinase/integrase n=1 Tax=unclassified Crossiella TaxID=2620835 RepID=UPI001FFFF60E|nr:MULTISPECIES: tyrosine-type recombinase/integrase [unclassified Crossiella]MCK2241842.1 tyrosine-type recombinase/integrase [Crossiella sp. S99.2]MCK2255745.1 tyrosine-type recombinase/integrase [Crossiella sp. S99.1]